MGREIKRVPLDFDWPLNKVWEGFLNPHYRKCATCKGSSRTLAMEWLEVIVELLMTAGEESVNRRHQPTMHPYLTCLIRRPEQRPSPEFADLTSGLAGRRLRDGLFGHDACDNWSATAKIIAAAGLPDTWGWCPTCNGSGVDPAVKAAYDAWTQTEPPKGPGWQVWETVSEGSPVSPVFPDASALTAWLVQQGYSAEAARRFTETAWAPSGVGVGGEFYRDIESLAAMPGKTE